MSDHHEIEHDCLSTFDADEIDPSPPIDGDE